MGKSSQKQTQESSPWAPAIPYLKEILPQAQQLQQSQEYIGMTPEQRATVDQQLQTVQQSQLPQQTTAIGQQLLQGQYTPDLNQINPLDLSAARSGQGALDPTAALMQALSGSPNMDVLGSMQAANSAQAQQDYQQAVDSAGRMFTEQINPAIRGGAIAAGQYGGSRGQLAQGVAARDIGEQLAKGAENLAESTLGAGNTLYGNAYQQAQQQAAGTGAMLNQQAQQQAAANQNLDWQRSLLQPQLDLQNQLQGIQTLGTGEASRLGQLQDIYNLQGTDAAEQQAQQDFDWNQLMQMAGLGSQIGGMGGTTVSTTKQNPGLLQSLGTAATLASGVSGLMGGLGGLGGATSGLGASMGGTIGSRYTPFTSSTNPLGLAPGMGGL